MLKLTDIKKTYKQPDGTSVPILDVPSFEMSAGEQVALIGPSGCGKTTLLHTIAGIIKPDSGIRADKIGYVFQTFNLLPAFTALENVVLGMSFGKRPASKQRAKDLIEQVGLGHRIDNKPAAMSVGEQQRVAVARAPANQRAIVQLIRDRCREENVALLMVTHSMEVADQFDRVDQLADLNRVVADARAAATSEAGS